MILPQHQAFSTKRLLEDQHGVLTLDFIFALMLIFGFSMIFFAVSITLSMVEVTQYISFTAARTFAGAHEDQTGQDGLARKKFAEIMAVPVFKKLYSLGWINLGALQLGDFNNDYPQDADAATFVGARIPFFAAILSLDIPFVGSTTSNSTTGHAMVSTYLMREVTTTECRENFNRARFQKLKNLTYGGKAVYGGVPSDSAALITDNGC